jgi:hypothetical protein
MFPHNFRAESGYQATCEYSKSLRFFYLTSSDAKKSIKSASAENSCQNQHNTYCTPPITGINPASKHCDTKNYPCNSIQIAYIFLYHHILHLKFNELLSVISPLLRKQGGSLKVSFYAPVFGLSETSGSFS